MDMKKQVELIESLVESALKNVDTDSVKTYKSLTMSAIVHTCIRFYLIGYNHGVNGKEPIFDEKEFEIQLRRMQEKVEKMLVERG